MVKTIELLLVETVDNLGIVGDVVTVRTGYARNFLLPRGLATTPSQEMMQALANKRAEAEKEMLRLREMRAAMVEKLDGFELSLERSCNDQGLLYGSVTQKDIADALDEQGFEIKPREVRLPHTIKRIDTYDIHIKLDHQLEAHIKLWVTPDRHIETDERDEMEFDNEGNLIEPGRRGRGRSRDEESAPDALGEEAPERAPTA